jgi:peptidyl-prolyl cis-trans isomerase B (cyclophilin B)
VSPNRRERAYARRRYERWQTKQAARRTRRRRMQRNAAAAAAAVALVAVVVGVLWLSTRGDPDATTPAAGAGPTPAATPGDGATPSAGSSDAGKDNPCGAPTSAPAAKPSSYPSAPPASQSGGKASELTLNTSCGTVRLELDGAKAPQAVSAMLFLAREKFFDGSPCHRLTTEGIFVLQCGDPTGTGGGGPGFSYGPVENAPEGDVYPAGTVAMARQSGNGSSMGSQFFLVYKKSTIPSDAAGGYTVLGTIAKGLDVVRSVAGGGVSGGGGDGAPVRAVSIESTRVAAG